MKLSMWILADWLKDYKAEPTIRDGGLHIESVRLFSTASPEDDTCLYIGRMRDLFVTENDNVICTNKNDLIVLHTAELDDVMNRILDAFAYYQSWHDRLLEAISSDRRPSELLDIANEIIPEPLYLLDSDQYAMALSTAFGQGSVNRLWDLMLENGTADLAFLTRLNKEYPQHMTNRGLYKMELPFLPNSSYNYNMFFRDRWIGLSCMIQRESDLPQSTIDLFHLFCRDIELWYLSHSQEQESLMIDSLFREALLSESAVNDAFMRQFQLRFHSLHAGKYILVLTVPREQSLLASHLCRELNLAFPDLLAILYQSYICVLLIDETGDHEAVFSKLVPFLKRNGCTGGCSRVFTDLKQISSRFREAVYAADYKKERLSAASTESHETYLCPFEKAALSFTLEEIRRHAAADLIHPDIIRLRDYDKKHHTEFTRTLETWLIKERSQSRTAASLHLHRNTLTYRLQRIRELLACDLEDDDTRLHLLLSFRLLKKQETV